MRTFYSVILVICLIVLVADCENLLALVVTKAVALVLAYVVGKMFVRTLTKDELNEKV